MKYCLTGEKNVCKDKSIKTRQLNSKMTILINKSKLYKLENFNYLNVAFISYKLTMWD